MSLGSHKIAWVIVAVCFVTVSAFAMLASSDPNATTLRTGAFGDTTVSSSSPDTNYGYTNTIFVSKSASGANLGLISFDAASLLEPNDVILSARVKLLVVSSTGTFPAVMTTARLLADFSETTVTYSTAPPAAPNPVTSFTFDKRPGPGKTIFLDVTAQFMAWKGSGQQSRFGIQLSMVDSTVNAGVAFASRENTYYEGPVLQIFTLPPGQTPYGYVIWLGGVFAIRPSN